MERRSLLGVLIGAFGVAAFACDGKLDPGAPNPGEQPVASDRANAGGQPAGARGSAPSLPGHPGAGGPGAGEPVVPASRCVRDDTSTPTVLLRTEGDPGGIAVDATSVYWTSAAIDGAIMRLPKSGGTNARFVDNQLSPRKILADGTHVYWSSSQISRQLLGGTTVETVDFSGVVAFAQDRDSIYWIGEATGGIRRMPKAGGPIVELAPNLPASPVDGLAVAGDRVYRTVRDTGKIVSVPVAGGPVETLAKDLQAPSSIVADATHIYWIDQKAETLSRMPVGGGPITKLADTGWLPWQLLLDDGVLYWTNVSPCMEGSSECATRPFDWPSVTRLKLDGGTPTVLACGDNPFGLAIDDEAVYWINRDDGRVRDGARLGVSIVRRPK